VAISGPAAARPAHQKQHNCLNLPSIQHSRVIRSPDKKQSRGTERAVSFGKSGFLVARSAMAIGVDLEHVAGINVLVHSLFLKGV
jgi:hypothetical protein